MGKAQKASKRAKTKSTHNESDFTASHASLDKLLADADTALTRSDYETAKNILTQAFQHSQGNDEAQVKILVQLGSVFLEVGLVDEARTAFETAEQTARTANIPPPIELYANLGQTSEDPREAWSWLNTAVDAAESRIVAVGTSDPETVAELQYAAGSALLGMTEIYMTDLCMEPEAESLCVQQLQRAVALNPENPEVYQMMASVRLSQQLPDEAKILALQGWGLWRNDTARAPPLDSQLALGKIMLELELPEYAIEILRIVLRQDDESLEACYVLGYAWVMLADRVKVDPHLVDGAAAGSTDPRECNAEALVLLSIVADDESLGDIAVHATELVASIEATGLTLEAAQDFLDQREAQRESQNDELDQE